MSEEILFHPTVVEIHTAQGSIFRGYIIESKLQSLMVTFVRPHESHSNVVLYGINPSTEKKEPKISIRKEDIRLIGDTFKAMMIEEAPGWQMEKMRPG